MSHENSQSTRKEKLWRDFLQAIRNGDENQVTGILIENVSPVRGRPHPFLTRLIPTTQGMLTALHLAVKHDKASIAKLLLEKGIDINAVSHPHECTALHMAVEQLDDNIGIIQILLGHKDINVNKTDVYGHTPIKIAAEIGNAEAVKLLLDKGADITIADKVDSTAIHAAADKGQYEVLQLLLPKAAAENPGIIVSQNKEQNTPLHLAVGKQCVTTVAVLIEYGAIVSSGVKNQHNKTPKELAAGNKRIIKLLESPSKASQPLWQTKLSTLGAKVIGRGGSVEADRVIHVSTPQFTIHNEFKTEARDGGSAAIGPGSEVHVGGSTVTSGPRSQPPPAAKSSFYVNVSGGNASIGDHSVTNVGTATPSPQPPRAAESSYNINISGGNASIGDHCVANVGTATPRFDSNSPTKTELKQLRQTKLFRPGDHVIGRGGSVEADTEQLPDDANDDDDDDDNNGGDDDGDGGDEDDNEDDVGNVGSEDITEAEQELPQQFHGLQLEGQEEHLEEQDQTKIDEEIVTSEGTYWPLKQEGVHLMFPADAVSEPTTIVVHKWKCSACSPPLQDHETIVSNVIEMSTVNGQALEFNAEVKLFLSHSAPDLKGYEMVLKRQIDKEYNEWEDVDGTQDLRSLSDIGGGCPSPNDIPDFFFPVAQAGITKCSTYTVVCRLKLSPSFTITSTGGSFSHPDYPGVTVTVPENAVAPEAKFPLQLKVQEVPNEEFEGQVFLGPVLRIVRSQVHFLKPVTIQLPVSLRDEREGIPDPLTCRVRVFFLRTNGEHKEWIEITDDLVNPASFDGTFVRFQVERFSGYSPVLDRRKENSIVTVIRSNLSRYIWNPPILAFFFAYFRPDSEAILLLICCPAHLRSEVIKELERKDITPVDVSSRKDMIPKYDKAFVFVSGGIRPYCTEDMEEFYLVFDSNSPTKTELKVRFVSNEDSAQVEFYSTPEPSKSTFLCKLHLKVPSLSVDRTGLYPSTAGTTEEAAIQGGPGNSVKALNVTLLASEWGSSMGGLSTINRNLAILFAKHSHVHVTLLVPQFACCEEDKRDAASCNITIHELQRRPGFDDPLDWLSFPPKDLAIDIVLGHGAKLGKQAQVIKESHSCKWVQVVHTAPEELGMHKNYSGAIAKGEDKNRAEVDLCKLSDLVVAVGPKLAEAYSSYLRFYGKHQDIIQLTPGTFHEFTTVKQAARDGGKFKVLTFGRGDSEDFSLKGYDIAAKAVTELKDSSYCLVFVGAPSGKEEEVKGNLLQCGISEDQLIVRKFLESKEKLKELFCEVDLAIMPSRTEGFGLTALEALSAGLPILVGGNSGFAYALRDLPSGKSFVVESKDPKEWAKAIVSVRQKERAQRLQEIQTLRTNYEEKYSWKDQCGALVEKMWIMAHETSGAY